MERYIYNTAGVDETAEAAIVKKAIEIAIDLNINLITLYVHTYSNTGWIERMFGRNSLKQLKNGYSHKGIVLNLKSHRTFENYGDDCILVALGQDSEKLFELESILRIKAILALPWIQDECLDWASNLNAYDLNGKTPMGTGSLPCAVEKALEQLTKTINISTGITHPNDKRRAKTFIRTLHKYDYELNVPSIKAYLVKNNWTKSGVDSIAELINTLNQGRYFQGGDTTGLQKYKNRWEEECSES